MMMPYTENDLKRAQDLVKELHGLKGFDAWANRIAKEIAAARAREFDAWADRIAKEIAAARARGDRPLSHPVSRPDGQTTDNKGNGA
jgi:hypothetical protein